MLKSALNALTRIHSRPALLKRLGQSVDTYTPCRITPSNYFRFLRGPEYITVRGVEFVIPLDSMLGEFTQKLTFDRIPDGGSFKLKYGSDSTDDFSSSSVAADIQTELREITGLQNIIVTGSFSLGFKIVFRGFSETPTLLEVEDNTLEEDGDPVTTSVAKTNTAWNEPIKKGDRIIDGTKTWAVDEIIEMNDLGAQTMAYRVRCD